MAVSLDDVLTAAPDGRLEIPDGWQQGRGAFGGLVLGAMTRRLAAEAGEARPLRSLSASIFAPVLVGAATVEATALHAGRAVSTLRAELSQEGQRRAHATAVFGAPRPGAPSWQRATPWSELPDRALPSPPAPAFIRHFELR